jgi:hypothetical protein
MVCFVTKNDFGSGGFTREVGSHFVFLAVRVLGAGKWLPEKTSEIVRVGGCETKVMAWLRHEKSGALFEFDMQVQDHAVCRFEIEGKNGQKV